MANGAKASSLKHDLAAGVVAGQIAGLTMAVVVMMVFTIFLGKGPLFPVQVIGSFVYGDAGIQGFHLPALLTGLLLHQLGPSLFWGLAAALVLRVTGLRQGPGLVMVCAGVGLVSQVVDVNLIMPVAMTALHGHDIWAEQVPAMWSWAAHLVFGVGLVSFAWAHRWLAPRFA